jgi:hypothetical protein
LVECCPTTHNLRSKQLRGLDQYTHQRQSTSAKTPPITTPSATDHVSSPPFGSLWFGSPFTRLTRPFAFASSGQHRSRRSDVSLRYYRPGACYISEQPRRRGEREECHQVRQSRFLSSAVDADHQPTPFADLGINVKKRLWCVPSTCIEATSRSIQPQQRQFCESDADDSLILHS